MKLKRLKSTLFRFALICGTFIILYNAKRTLDLKNVVLDKRILAFIDESGDIKQEQFSLSKTIIITNITSKTTKRGIAKSTLSNSSTIAAIPKSTIPEKLFLTVILGGRMGNHMFNYASVLGLARALGREFFVSSGKDLESLFTVSHIRTDINTKGWPTINVTKFGSFDNKLMKLPPKNITLFGSLQCWRYFQHIHKEIIREFTLKADIENKVQRTLATYRNRLENHVLVAVHVRRGDFLKPYWTKFGVDVANVSYIVKAFSKMRSLLTNQNITFLVSSDDLNWCKNNLNYTGVEVLPPGSAADHFAILSSCDHAIITIGTYGWWIGALTNGITIYYKNFVTKNSQLDKHGFYEYYPIGWIGLEN